jgi:DUF1009 family protein
MEDASVTISDKPKRIGLMAGWGRFPLVVAEALKKQGYETYCLGVVDHADPKLAEVCTDFQWSGLAKFGSAIRYFKRRGVTEAMMAGKIFKVKLFGRFAWFHHLPDLRTIRLLIPFFWTRQKDCRDDTLLMAVVDEFGSEGIRLSAPTDYAPELLVKPGQLTRRGPSFAQQKDIEFGWRMAKEMGRLDIGQSVAVKNQAVLAVEAVEGTDQNIRRAGTLCKAGHFTVVKVAKPQQDMRFDVPTIGVGTLETMLESGGEVLAIEAGMTILLDEKEVLAFADRHKMIIVSLTDADVAPKSEQPK